MKQPVTGRIDKIKVVGNQKNLKGYRSGGVWPQLPAGNVGGFAAPIVAGDNRRWRSSLQNKRLPL